MALSRENSMIIPADPDYYYPSNMSFPSSPGSSPLSPAPSPPTTVGCFPGFPQESYFLDAPMLCSDGQQQQCRREDKSVSTFINKLFKMVNDKRHQDLIAWSVSGRSFLIMDSKLFSKEVLPEYFKHGNFSSFVRQLNMYGFHKVNKTPRGKRGVQQDEIWEFSHPKFERGCPERLCDIKRKVVESDVLRRETGDMQVCFNMIQASQNDLLEQFHTLQGNFSNLIQGFEDLKKNQNQIQIGIYRLAELGQAKTDLSLLSTDPSVYTPPVLITSPQSSAPQVQDSMFFDASSSGPPLPPSPMSTGAMSSASSYFSLGDESISNM